MFFRQNSHNTSAHESGESSNVPAESASSGWGWGSWGAVLNQATSTMTSGLSQVIEKVETTLGIPEPGELQDEAFPKDEKNEVITMEPKPAEIDRGVEGNKNSTGMLLVSPTVPYHKPWANSFEIILRMLALYHM